MRTRLPVTLLALSLCTTVVAHGISEADQIRAQGGGILEFLRQGAVHMLTGYDHLLFLFGVIFFLSKFTDIVKFITAFTLGHCITLIGATFLGIQANYYLIDAVIALTVCYKGFDNVGGFEKYFGMKSPNILAMVFVFGLIHGFGLSTRLQELTIGKGFDLLGKILAFNVGVEFGQIAALLVMLVVLTGWRKTRSFERFSVAANTGLIILGALLLLKQLHGYDHQQDPMGFYSEKAHQHAHEDLGMSMRGTPPLPPGYHIDPGDTVPHKDHDTPAAANAAYPAVIDRIFETRKSVKAAKTDEEILDVHHAVESMHDDLVLLRSLVAEYKTLDLEQIDAALESATAARKLIGEQAHEGNVAETKKLIAQFDKSVLAIEELINHPVTPGSEALPEGYHVDHPGGVPHKDH